jgi:hypothetical protein
VPTAANCLVVPTAIEEAGGVTDIDISVAPVTVSDAVPLTEPEVAVIVDVPAPTPVPRPAEVIVATLVDELDQVRFVNNCVLPSSKLPIALNCRVVPAAIDCVAGVTATDVRCAATTVRVDESVRAPRFAVMFVVPAARVVTTPVAFTVAIDVSEELQVTPADKSALLPSL